MLKEFHYKIDWRTKGHLPGHHRSTQSGGGLEFRGNVPLLASPDPRRLDIRASLSDPFEQWFVRSFRQRSQVPIYLIVDLSASLGFSGERRKMDVLADLVESVVYSVHRTGDRFAFIGCDEILREDFLLPPTHSLGAGLDLAQRLRKLDPGGRSAAGLLDAGRYVTKQRSLIFLVSDFHFEESLLKSLLQSLTGHRVCPMVLWDRAEFERLPRFGLATARDRESGAKRTLLLRPSFHERLRESYAARRAWLKRMFADYGTQALFFEDGFNAERVTQYFYHAEELADARIA
jgi:uncharacterized protein (DUF58 family)